jgi:hypothetical protein
MAIAEDYTPGAHSDRQPDVLPGLLRGYRFTVCDSPAAAGRALDVRRQVYGGTGYNLPVPDPYDDRSWLLMAEETATGKAVGTMRVTPRFTGRLEAEEYFELPRRFRSPLAFELNRFAILPGYRKGSTFLPVVSLGLFKMVHDLLFALDARYMVIASKPERVWTYQWMRFKSTGLVKPYGKLAGAEHELLTYDMRRAPEILVGHPFREFFVSARYDEVELPRRLPSLGILPDEQPLRVAVGA